MLDKLNEIEFSWFLSNFDESDISKIQDLIVNLCKWNEEEQLELGNIIITIKCFNLWRDNSWTSSIHKNVKSEKTKEELIDYLKNLDKNWKISLNTKLDDWYVFNINLEIEYKNEIWEDEDTLAYVDGILSLEDELTGE